MEVETSLDLILHKKDDLCTSSLPQCCLCDKQFSKIDVLKRHMKSHATLSCHLCLEIFKDRLSLARHQVEVHTVDRTFSCSQCDKTFKEIRTLRLHLKIHNLEYPEQCSVCNKVFRTKWQLKQHLMDHGGERPYPCPECIFTCKTKQQLNEHRRKHSGEKAYSCPHCNTRFTYRNGLIKHTKLNRCPKKIITPEGATVIKKRSRIISKYILQEEDLNNNISKQEKIELDQKILDVLKRRSQIQKMAEDTLLDDNVSLEVAKQQEKLDNLNRSKMANTMITTSTDISSWAATLPAGTKVTVTHYDASKKHGQDELIATPTRTETIIVTENLEERIQHQALQQRRLVMSKGSIASILRPLSTHSISPAQFHSQEALNLFSSIGFPNYTESFAVDPNEILRKEKFIKSEPATPSISESFMPTFTLNNSFQRNTLHSLHSYLGEEVKNEPIDNYCPYNEIKKEVLSELFDCEPNLLLDSNDNSSLLYPSLPQDKQFNSEISLNLKIEPFSPLGSLDSGNEEGAEEFDTQFTIKQEEQEENETMINQKNFMEDCCTEKKQLFFESNLENIRSGIPLPDFDVDLNTLLDELQETDAALAFKWETEPSFRKNHYKDLISSV